jgi:hypothetical protein
LPGDPVLLLGIEARRLRVCPPCSQAAVRRRTSPEESFLCVEWLGTVGWSEANEIAVARRTRGTVRSERAKGASKGWRKQGME